VSQLARLHRTLIDAARGFGHVESEDGCASIEDAGGIGAGSGQMPFATAFRVGIVDPMVGLREFTITISETTRRR